MNAYLPYQVNVEMSAGSIKKIFKTLYFSIDGRLLLMGWILGPLVAFADETLAPKIPGRGNSQRPPMTDIHDIKPLVDMGGDIPWSLILVITAVLIISLAAFLYWRHFRKSIDVNDVMVELPPEVNAHRALDQIIDVNQIDGKTFYYNLSTILRQYIFERFQLNAPEMTTEELLPRLGPLNLDPDLYNGFSRLCQGADPIKFAGQRPQIRQMELDLMFVRKFVDGTTLKTDSVDAPSLKDESCARERD
jgi:hypothetical protein